MNPLDQQNSTGHHHRGSSHRAETLRLTTGNWDLPAQGGPAQQGSPTRHQQSGFSGGFVLPDNNNDISASPTSLTSSSSAFSVQRNSTQQGPPVVVPTVDDDECFAWFVAVDQDESGQVSHEELRSGLLNDNGLSFSVGTVKFLMRIFDLDGNGEISFEEFKPLWNLIMQWLQMFDAFDVDGDGRINANELSQALDHYKFPVGQPVIDMLITKYGVVPPPPRNWHPSRPLPLQMDMDHFICACVVVQQMWGLYDTFTAGRPGLGQTQMSRDDFLKAVISLP